LGAALISVSFSSGRIPASVFSWICSTIQPLPGAPPCAVFFWIFYPSSFCLITCADITRLCTLVFISFKLFYGFAEGAGITHHEVLPANYKMDAAFALNWASDLSVLCIATIITGLSSAIKCLCRFCEGIKRLYNATTITGLRCVAGKTGLHMPNLDASIYGELFERLINSAFRADHQEPLIQAVKAYQAPQVV
jgi:hypothetical protein